MVVIMDIMIIDSHMYTNNPYNLYYYYLNYNPLYQLLLVIYIVRYSV